MPAFPNGFYRIKVGGETRYTYFDSRSHLLTATEVDRCIAPSEARCLLLRIGVLLPIISGNRAQSSAVIGNWPRCSSVLAFP